MPEVDKYEKAIKKEHQGNYLGFKSKQAGQVVVIYSQKILILWGINKKIQLK